MRLIRSSQKLCGGDGQRLLRCPVARSQRSMPHNCEMPFFYWDAELLFRIREEAWRCVRWRLGIVSKHLIFVAGMMRAGTSAVTRVLSQCGSAPPQAVFGATDWNRRGLWEPRRCQYSEFEVFVLAGCHARRRSCVFRSKSIPIPWHREHGLKVITVERELERWERLPDRCSSNAHR